VRARGATAVAVFLGVLAVATISEAGMGRPRGEPELAAVPSATGVHLTWTPPTSEGGSPLQGYRIYRGASDAALSLLATVGVQHEYTDAGAAAGETYRYQVAAFNKRGESARSALAIATPPPPPRATPHAPGTLVFTFDDTTRYDIDSAAMLEARGFRGTYFVVSGYLGTGARELGPADIVSLRSRGHDIQSHTVTHPDLTNLSEAELRRELEGSKAALEEILGAPVRHIAYPFGTYDARVIEATRLTYASARAATDSINETRIADPFRTPGIMLKRDTTLEQAKGYVDFAIANDRTVIFLLESITTTPTEWDWTPALFGELLDYVAERGPAVKTVDEAFQLPAPPPKATANGTVVFTFDDGFASQLQAATILENHGYRATFYVASGLLRNGATGTGYMSAAEVAMLSSRGHDIESITLNHADLRTLTDAELQRELADPRIALEAITGRPVQHVAYPFNSFDARVLNATMLEYETGRSVNGDLENQDPYQLPGVPVLRATSVTQVLGYLDYATEQGAPLVLVLHDVSWEPSEIGWTPADLEALLDRLDGRGAAVRTISELYP